MSEVGDIQRLVEGQHNQPTAWATTDGRQFVFLPAGNGAFRCEQISLPNAADVLMPKIVTQHVKLQTKQSLIDYVLRFATSDSVIFADVENGTVTAIIDYHKVTEPANKAPQLCTHRSSFKLQASMEWEEWNAINGELQSHLDFASFIEENAQDIMSPSGADLLEIVRSLKGAKNATWDEDYGSGAMVKRNASSSIALHSNKGDIELPRQFEIAIPVYFREAAVSLHALTRWDVDNGGLQLGYKIVRTQTVQQNELQRIVKEIGSACGLTLLFGTPA